MRFPDSFWYEDMITRLVMMRMAKRISLCSKVVYHKTDHQTNAAKILWKKGNIKAVDQYWLSYSLVQYASKDLGLPQTSILYSQLLKEYGYLLYSRTEELPLKTRQAIFTLASSFLKTLYLPEYHFERVNNSYNKALLDKNFFLWEYLSEKEWLKKQIKF